MSDGPRTCPHCGFELRPPTEIEKAMIAEAGVVSRAVLEAEPQAPPAREIEVLYNGEKL
jgi:hypothetical protein